MAEAAFADIELPLTLTVFTHLEDVSLERRERSVFNYVAGTAAAIEGMTSRLFGDAQRARVGLQRYARELGHREQVRRAGEAVEAVDVDRALWELSDAFGPHDGYVLNFVASDIRRALELGHRADGSPHFVLGFWANRRAPAPALFLTCTAIEFEEGSLKSKLALLAKGGSLLVALLAAGAAPIAQDQFERLRVQQEVRMVYGAERCIATTTLDIDGRAMLDATASEMNFWNASSPLARQRAVCLVQLSLSLSGYQVGPIDGLDGPQTMQQLAAFARRHKTDLKDPALFRELAKALHAGARDLARK